MEALAWTSVPGDGAAQVWTQSWTWGSPWWEVPPTLYLFSEKWEAWLSAEREDGGGSGNFEGREGGEIGVRKSGK